MLVHRQFTALNVMLNLHRVAKRVEIGRSFNRNQLLDWLRPDLD